MSAVDDSTTTAKSLDVPPLAAASPSTPPLFSLERSSQSNIKEPLAFKVARVLVILVLLAAFVGILLINLHRPPNDSKLQASDTAWLNNLQLPSFELAASSNHTLVTSLNCSYDQPVSKLPNVTQFMLDNKRSVRLDAWDKFQRAKPTVPNYQNLTDAEILRWLRSTGWYAFSTFFLEDLIDPSTSPEFTLDGVLSTERWGSYMVSDSVILWERKSAITCRIGNLVEISTENATSTTLTLLQPSNTTVLASVKPDDYRDEVIPLVQGLHTILTFEPSQNCRELMERMFATTPTQATLCDDYTYTLTATRTLPANVELLPPSLRDVPVAGYTYVTIRVKNDNGIVSVTKKTQKFDYGALAKLASIFSTISILLLVYRLVMGDTKRNPFGWMQRYILRRKTKQFVEQVNATKDRDEWVENVLFTLYLDGNGLHYRKHGFLKRLRKKLKRFRKDRKQKEDASSRV